MVTPHVTFPLVFGTTVIWASASLGAFNKTLGAAPDSQATHPKNCRREYPILFRRHNMTLGAGVLSKDSGLERYTGKVTQDISLVRRSISSVSASRDQHMCEGWNQLSQESRRPQNETG